MLEHWNGLNFPYRAEFDEEEKAIYVYLQTWDIEGNQYDDELIMKVHGYQALNSIHMI